MSTEPDIITTSEDGSPYIRTFAKDFAALSGKNLGGSEKPVPKKLETTKVMPERDDSLTLPPILAGDIVHEEVPLPAALKPPIETESVTPAPLSDSEREVILARLKARFAEQGPEVKTAAPLPAKPLEPTPYREPLPPVTAAEVTQPLPEILPPTLVPEEGPSPLHTYTSDFAARIDKKKATRFSVLAAENDAHVRAPRTAKKVPLVPIIAGIVLLIVGSGGVVAAYLYMNSTAPIASVIAPPMLIIPDSKVALSGTGANLLRAFADQANQPLAANSIALTYINVSTTTSRGVIEEPGTGGAFITELSLPAPDILLRNIDPTSMVGIVNAGGETRPFFILRVTSYERTFSGMLTWEGSLGRNLAMLYPRYPAPVAATPAATTTATTTQKLGTKKTVTAPITTSASISDPTLPAAQFIDEAVANHDARVLKDMAGRTLILYGYADKQTLIICRDEAAFILLLGRLSANTH